MEKDGWNRAVSFLVISHDNSLIPFAYRLKLQGHPTQLVVYSERYNDAFENWAGKFDHILPAKEINVEKALEPTLELARKGEVTVLSDNRKVSKMFEGVPGFFGVAEMEEFGAPVSRIRLGGWYDGTSLTHPHLLVCDVGVWPGGFGVQSLGGLTLLRLTEENENPFSQITQPVEKLLNEKYQFKGLVQIGLDEGMTGGLEVQGVQLGWPFLHTHAFLSELDNFGQFLTGAGLPLPRKAVVVVPVSIPPWPVAPGGGSASRRAGREVGGLTPKQMSKVFWHDVRLDLDKRKVSSAGLDGLLGVTRGAADTPELARLRALSIALAIQVEEKQLRPDAGALVLRTLCEFEERTGIAL